MKAQHLRVAMAALAAVVCGEPEPTANVAAPTVLFVGCEAILAGQVCALRAGAVLSLWVQAPPEARVVLEWDGEPREATWEAAEGGRRTRFMSEGTAGMLTLRDADLGWRWKLTLQPEAARAEALRAADAAFAAERLDEAEQALAAALPGLQGPGLADGLKLRGDIEFRRKRMAAAEAAYRPAFEQAVVEGMPQSASTIALTAGWICMTQTLDLACARRWLEHHAELTTLLPEARLRHAYSAGLLADAEDDTGTAIGSFSAYIKDARALGLTRDLAAGLLKLGAVYSRVGDSARALPLYAELLALQGLSARDRALALHSEAWVLLVAHMRGESGDDPRPRFVEALRTFGPGGEFQDATVAAEVRVNLALAQMVAGDVAEARSTITPLDPPDVRIARWKELILGRIELAERDGAAALRRFEALAATAAAQRDRGIEWQATVHAGEALEQLGETTAALLRYRRAARLHAGRLAALNLSAGRELFAAEGDAGARQLVRLLVRLGRAEEAVCAARKARAQVFAVAAAAVRDRAALAEHRRRRERLDAELAATWQRPWLIGELERARLRAEQDALAGELDALLLGQVPQGMSEETVEPECAGLRPPGPGELLLLYYPLELGYAGFAVDRSGVLAAELPEPEPATEPAARAERLLGPFAAAIERAERIEIVASGRLSAENFHALPWRGRPLIERAPVAYRLDLPRAADRAAPRTAIQLAPLSNLTATQAELEAGARALAEHGIATKQLRGDEADLGGQLGVDILHFVGHAHADGWASALDLGDERRLTAAELLAGTVPAVAVLAGCETGLPDPRAHAGGISLAHALLLAGSSAVIATDAKIADELAPTVTPMVLAALAEGIDPAEALRRAQVGQLRRHDWMRFRAFVP